MLNPDIKILGLSLLKRKEIRKTYKNLEKHSLE